jgi:hypothetical protein
VWCGGGEINNVRVAVVAMGERQTLELDGWP